MKHQYETKHVNYSYFNKYMVNHIGFEKREMCSEQKCIGLTIKLMIIFSLKKKENSPTRQKPCTLKVISWLQKILYKISTLNDENTMSEEKIFFCETEKIFFLFFIILF